MMGNRRVFIQWVRATWIGWILGLPIIIVLALIGEAVQIGGAQVLVGIGMGTGIGLLQRRVIWRVIDRSTPWLWSCIIGLALPFLVWDITRAAGWEFAYSLYLSVALGGLIVGVWQAIILRPHFRNTGWWIVGNAVGWPLAAGTAAVADSLSRSQSLRGIWGALAFLGIVAGGGLILGVATAESLVRLQRSVKEKAENGSTKDVRKTWNVTP